MITFVQLLKCKKHSVSSMSKYKSKNLIKGVSFSEAVGGLHWLNVCPAVFWCVKSLWNICHYWILSLFQYRESSVQKLAHLCSQRPWVRKQPKELANKLSLIPAGVRHVSECFVKWGPKSISMFIEDSRMQILFFWEEGPSHTAFTTKPKAK